MALSGFLFRLKTPSGAVATQFDRPQGASFLEVGSFQSNSFELNSNAIEITSKNPNGENMTILNGRGILTLTTSGSGFIDSSALQKELEANKISQKLRWFELNRDDDRSFTFKGKIVSFSVEGSFDGALTFSISIQSSGTVYVRDKDGTSFNSGVPRVPSLTTLLRAFDVVLSHTSNYDATANPDKEVFVDEFVKIVATNFDSSSKTTKAPVDRISLQGSAAANESGFPLFFLKEGEVGQRSVRVKNATLDTYIDNYEFISDLEDTNGDTWKCFVVYELLGNGETLGVNIEVGIGS